MIFSFSTITRFINHPFIYIKYNYIIFSIFYTVNNYGRTYAPLITKDDYIVSTFEKIKTSYFDSKSSAVTSIFAALIQDNDLDDDLLGKLQQMIERRKQKK